jgi:hypothetical protein
MAKTSISGCGVKIEWKAPAFSGAEILKYKIEIQSKTGAFLVFKGCGTNGKKVSCQVPALDLVKSPFNLARKDRIVVKISAFNIKGWSEPSPATTNDLEIPTKPLPLTKAPELVRKLLNDITFKWTLALKGDGKVTYEIYSAVKSDTTLQKLAFSTST